MTNNKSAASSDQALVNTFSRLFIQIFPLLTNDVPPLKSFLPQIFCTACLRPIPSTNPKFEAVWLNSPDPGRLALPPHPMAGGQIPKLTRLLHKEKKFCSGCRILLSFYTFVVKFECICCSLFLPYGRSAVATG